MLNSKLWKLDYKQIVVIERVSVVTTIISGLLWVLYPNSLEPFVFILTVLISGILEFLRQNERLKSKKKEELYDSYNLKINTSLSVKEVLEVVLTEIEIITKTDYNQIILDITEMHSSHLYIVADAIPNHKQRYDFVIFEGLIGKSYKKGETIIVNNTSVIKEYFNAVSETKSEICVPIIYNNKILGVINSESELANYYTFETRENLEVLSETLATNLNRLEWKRITEIGQLVRIKRKPIFTQKQNGN